MEPAAELYLPLGEPTLQLVLDETRSFTHVLRTLAPHEIAALLVIARLPPATERATGLSERAIAVAVDACTLVVAESGPDALVGHVLPALGRSRIDAGYRRLAALRLALLDEADVAAADFLARDGRWDAGFTERHRKALAGSLVRLAAGPARALHLTGEQSRVYRELQAQSDEPLHVQGYAGTGKSALIRALVALLAPKGARILVLAEHRRQLDATPIDPRHARHVDKSTFSALASRIVPEDLTSPAYRNFFRTGRSRAELPDAELIDVLGIRASGDFSAEEIVRSVRDTLRVFCRSDEATPVERHVPRQARLAFDPATRAAVVRHARALWSAIVSRPSATLAPLVREHHLVKWVSLNRWPIPPPYTHVLVDESHDLPDVVRRILDSSPQTVTTLGDDYQNLRGHVAPRRAFVRDREMTTSLRTARSVETLVNPIIAAHPGGTKAPFVGNRLNEVEIVVYASARAAVPNEPAVILVDDTWGLFEWAQRVASGGRDLELMSDRLDLDRFVKDCIELRAHGTRGRHRELFRFGSWDALAEHHGASLGFRRIERLLRQGYGYPDWARTRRRLVGRAGGLHAVGMIGDALNQEFDTVMIAPDVLRDAEARRRAAFGSSVYVALTRARHRLLVPDELRHWIEDLSGRRDARPRAGERATL